MFSPFEAEQRPGTLGGASGIKSLLKANLVAQAFNPSHWKAEAGGSLELEVGLKMSSRTVRAT